MAASPARSIRALDILLPAGQTNCVPIVLGGEGGETAITLSVCFDTNLLSSVSVQRGSDAGDASLSVNTIQASRGRVGVSLMRSDGATFPAGDKVLVEVCFRSTTANGIVTTPVAICETPVGRDILDADRKSVV